MEKKEAHMRRIVLGLLLCLSAMSTAAQETFVPYERLVMMRYDPAREEFQGYGDLYSWQPGETLLFRETTYGYNDRPILSPDGTKLVYLSLPQEFVSGNVDMTMWNGPYPTNIWLMDLTTAPGDADRFTRIADQETGLPLDADERTWQRRSQPVWSPDGSQLAWVELDMINTAFSGRVMIYDTRSGRTEIAASGVSLGYADAGHWNIPNLVGWGSEIAHISTNAGVYPNHPKNSFGTLLDTFDIRGMLSSTPISYFDSYEDQLSDVRMVLHNQMWTVGLNYLDEEWVVYDSINNTYQQLQNPPYLKAARGIRWTGHPVSGAPLVFQWRHNGILVNDLPSYEPVTFTPDGSPVWVNEAGELLTVEDDVVQPLLPPTDDTLRVMFAVWTPSIWTTDGKSTYVTPTIVP
jgi:hypothetical protein